MTKAAKKAGKAQKKRIVEQAVKESFSAKAAKVTEETKTPAGKPYMILVDAQAVAYLRVAVGPEGKKSQYIINTGSKAVDVIEMDKATAKARGLTEVPEASVLEAAKVLAKPLVSGIIVSERATKYLNEILNDPEMIEMAKAKAAKATTKKSAAPKTAKGATTRATVDAVVAFKKLQKDGELPPQAVAIVELLKKSGELQVSKLLEKMSAVVKTKQTMQIIFSFYKKRMIDGGFIAVKG